jgi:hypothetical protein
MHYGIPRRSGRYPYGSGERPFQGEDKEAIRAAKKLAKDERYKMSVQKRLDKTVKRYEKAQNKANKASNKAQKKAYSHFASYNSANKAMDKAAKKQFKADKVAYKGNKIYTRAQKKLKNSQISLDEETIKKGKMFADRVFQASSNLAVANANARIAKKKKR